MFLRDVVCSRSDDDVLRDANVFRDDDILSNVMF